jgi:hypothetical protein
MVKLTTLDIDLDTCKNDLIEFQALLNSDDELDETPFLQFFRSHPHLILLMGNLGLQESSHYKAEFNLFNEFRADFAISNREQNSYVFVEFEEATKYCIFEPVGNSPGIIRFQWSKIFEHGYSQIIDWFYRLDDFAETKKFKEHFSVDEIDYSGYLVIGRKKSSIPNFGYQARLDWRSKKILVNGRSVICLTYDELYIELQRKIDEWDLSF